MRYIRFRRQIFIISLAHSDAMVAVLEVLVVKGIRATDVGHRCLKNSLVLYTYLNYLILFFYYETDTIIILLVFCSSKVKNKVL